MSKTTTTNSRTEAAAATLGKLATAPAEEPIPARVQNLIDKANAAHEAGMTRLRLLSEDWLACGEHCRTLKERRHSAQLAWESWADTHLRFGHRMANNYIRLFEHRQDSRIRKELEQHPDATIARLLRAIAVPGKGRTAKPKARGGPAITPTALVEAINHLPDAVVLDALADHGGRFAETDDARAFASAMSSAAAASVKGGAA